MTQVHGEVARGFERVKEAFTANFEKHGEVGAACSVYHRGKKVVDLWGGVADEESGRLWPEDGLVLVASSTKGATVFCLRKPSHAPGRKNPSARMPCSWEFPCASAWALC